MAHLVDTVSSLHIYPCHITDQNIEKVYYYTYPWFITQGLFYCFHICAGQVGNSSESLCSLEKYSTDDWRAGRIVELPHLSAELSLNCNLKSFRVPYQVRTSVAQGDKLVDNIEFIILFPFPASDTNLSPALLGIISIINVCIQIFDSDSTSGGTQH